MHPKTAMDLYKQLVVAEMMNPVLEAGFLTLVKEHYMKNWAELYLFCGHVPKNSCLCTSVHYELVIKASTPLEILRSLVLYHLACDGLPPSTVNEHVKKILPEAREERNAVLVGEGNSQSEKVQNYFLNV